MFYCTSKRPRHSLKCDFEVTEYREFSNCFTATSGCVCRACIFARGKNLCFKITQSKFSNNRKMWDETFEICLRASTIYWLYWDWNKDLWLLGKYMLCFLSCLFTLVSGFPIAHGYQRKAVREKHCNIWTTLLFMESWHFWFTCSKIIIRYLKIGMAWTNWQREQTLPFAIQGQALTC